MDGERELKTKTMEEHCVEAWKFLFENSDKSLNCPTSNIFLMAHSAGGRCVAEIFKKYKEEFKKKIKCLIFTDAFYHKIFEHDSLLSKFNWAKVGIHFKKTEKGLPLGQKFKS